MALVTLLAAADQRGQAAQVWTGGAHILRWYRRRLEVFEPLLGADEPSSERCWQLVFDGASTTLPALGSERPAKRARAEE